MAFCSFRVTRLTWADSAIMARCAKRFKRDAQQDRRGMARKPNQHISYRVVPLALRQLREQAGLTQRGLATKIKRPQWFVARCETGSRRIDVAEFCEWSLGCGVDPKLALDLIRRGG